jgi:hypothetical protein
LGVCTEILCKNGAFGVNKMDVMPAVEGQIARFQVEHFDGVIEMIMQIRGVHAWNLACYGEIWLGSLLVDGLRS